MVYALELTGWPLERFEVVQRWKPADQMEAVAFRGSKIP